MTATARQVSKLDYALETLGRGFRVYPMEPNSDQPAFPEADCFATRDEGQIIEWWGKNPEYNIGIATDNLLAFCVKTAAGATELGRLLTHPDTPKTARIIIDRGEFVEQENYVLFLAPKGVNVEARIDIAPGVDVLSFADVIIGPGSKFDGLQSVSNAHPAAPAPLFLMQTCGVELPAESDSMSNVIPMNKGVAPAPEPVTTVPVPVKTKKEWAKEAASSGISVFPVRGYVDPGSGASPEQRDAAAKAAKTPLIANWQNLATQDPRQIDEWWEQWPDANIGGSTEHLVAVDVDPRNGGSDTLAFLETVEDFPDTAINRTQGGGKHLIYAAPDGRPVKGGVNKLGKGVDIKAGGGYILLPGSTIDGRAYARENDRPIAKAPTWIVERCNATKPKTDAAGKRIAPDDDAARGAAEQWLATKAPRAESGTRDNTAYRVGAMLGDFGCGYDTRVELLLRWNETHCEPPLDTEDLERIADSAGRNRENALGKLHQLAPGFEAVEIDESRAPKPAAPPATGLATPLMQFDPVGLEPRPWVIPGFACRGRVTLLAGPGGVAKSTYYLMVAIATVAGRGDICGFPIIKRERVWVWNQEDDIAEMQRRVAAIMKAFNVSWDDLRDEEGAPMLFLDSGVDKPLMLANRSAEHSIVAGRQVADVIATAKANRIAVLILDPLVEFHEASENDNVQMRAVVGQVRRIAVEADCATMLSTHTRKPPVASSDGFAGEMDAARGASAQLGVVRIGATIFSMSPKQAKEYRLAEGTTHLDYVRIDIAKNNLAPVLPDPIWFRREGVRVGGGLEQNGESVGVLRPVALDKKVTAPSAVHLPDVLAEIIATKLSREKHFKVSDVLAIATPPQQALFGDTKNRARRIAETFGGDDATPTGAGILTKTSARGKEMTLYLGPTSSLPQQPKTGGRSSESDDDTEA